jgi:hypothetical protein
MTRLAVTAVLVASYVLLSAGSGRADQLGSDQALAILANAEAAFAAPEAAWFDDAQSRLRDEAKRVSEAMDAHNPADAAAWKAHLRWEMLERNLGPRETIDVGELEIVRRWMYSNREGLEWPFFAPLRTAMDEYLDAAYTMTRADLQGEFNRNVAIARQQVVALAYEPNDVNAAALGRTLGWFERTRQLTDATTALQKLLSRSNLQATVHESLIQRVMGSLATDISETVSLTERVETTPTNPLQRPREMTVRGKATMTGSVQLDVVPNADVAEVAIVYEGDVGSTARAQTGPVTLNLRVTGTARATRPAYVTGRKIELGETAVTPQVATRIARINAPNEVVKSIARRRANHPQSRSQMNSQARSTAVEQLTLKFDERVEEGLEQIQADIERTRTAAGALRDASAPLAREGAVPTFAGTESSDTLVKLNVLAKQRGQFGAATELPADMAEGDVVIGVHVSFINNMAETILGGKTLSDSFVMKYAKVLHAELPLPLMVHSRTPRWAISMAKYRPLELVIAGPNEAVLVSRVVALEVDGVTTEMNAVARTTYQIRQDEFGDVALVRQGDMELVAEGTAEARAFLAAKLEAFFGPTLTGGGVIVPAGGALAAMKQLEWHGVRADRDWIVTAWDVPAAAIQEMIRSQQEKLEQPEGGATLAAPNGSVEAPSEASAPLPRRG